MSAAAATSSHGATPTSSHDAVPTSSHVGALVLGLAFPMAALLLAALQVPLSDEYPRPPERTALHVQLVAQVLMASLFFVTLFPSVRLAAAVIASGWPFVLLAGVLASAPRAVVVGAAAYASAWMVILAAWSLFLLPRGRAWRVAGTLAVTLWTLMPPALGYLRAEFGAGPALDPVSPGRLATDDSAAAAVPPPAARPRDPLAGALQLLDSQGTSATPWHPLVLAAAATTLALTGRIAIAWHARRKKSASATPPKRVPEKPS